MIHIKTIFIIAFWIFATVLFSMVGSEPEGDDQTITWYPFEWLPSDSHSNLANPRAIMRFHPVLEGLTGPRGFQLCFDVADSYIYESGFNHFLWRKPDLERKIFRFQAAGRTQTRVIEDMEVILDGTLLGYNELRVIDARNEPENAVVSGFFGYNFFRSIKKIVVIDHKGSQFALLDQLPEDWERKAHLVRMQTSPSFLGLRIRAGGRTIRLSFDGDPIPALVLYRNRDFRRIASDRAVPDSLRYFLPNSNKHIMLGGKEPQADLYFGPYKLKNHNVYLMPEKKHRLGKDKGLITQPFFEDYYLILDFRNNRFGIMPR